MGNVMKLKLNRQALAVKLEERKGAVDAIDQIEARFEADPKSVTEAEVQRAADNLKETDTEIDVLEARGAELLTAVERDAAMERLQSAIVPGSGAKPEARGGGTVRTPGDGVVVREPRTYTEHTNIFGEKISFFQDAYRSEKGDRKASERIARHAAEVEVEQREASERATATGAYAGLVVPQYLTDMVAPVLRAGRPFANAVFHHELPGRGMQLIIPRGTTGATTAVQATENSAVSNTDEVLANLTVNVVTIAGQQDVSRQALERGEMIDQFVYGDLARAYAANLDNQIINGTGASGQHLGLVNQGGISAATAFGAAPSITNVNLKIAGQETAVSSVGSGLFAKALMMHARRWGWFKAQVDTTGRPVVMSYDVPNFNTLALIQNQGGSEDAGGANNLGDWQYVGKHSSGLPIISDLNVPTTVGTNVEDLIFALDIMELHLWEEGSGAPQELRFEQTTGGSLTTKLVVYGYSAFTAGRYPGATGKIGGLDTTATFGLVAPSF